MVNKSNRLSLPFFQYTTIFLGLVVPVISYFWAPINPESWLPAGIGLIFTIVLTMFPLQLESLRIDLIHVISLAMGLAYGPTSAIWMVTLGMPLGRLISLVLPFYKLRSATKRRGWRLLFNRLGLQTLPLGLTFLFLQMDSGIQSPPTSPTIQSLLIPIALFAGLQGFIISMNYILSQPVSWNTAIRDFLLIGLIEIVPFPFIIIANLVYPIIQFGSLIALGGASTILAVLIYSMQTTKTGLERRLQELSTLDKITHTLQSTLEMENLLLVIHNQVTRLMGVDSFFVALFDPDHDEIWYPLAVKNGKRRVWPRRKLTDRLTDRVIREEKPIMLPKKAHRELKKIGLPPGEDLLNSWLGVPLITPEGTIGCLASFSATPDSEFTQQDLELFTILSGQVSVAISNALLFKQAQERTRQLEKLNQISSMITASLDLREVLAKVCESAIQVGGGQHSAIYLLDETKGELWLAHSQGLSEDYVDNSLSFSCADSQRARCLRTGMPNLKGELDVSEMETGLIDLLSRENILAFGDFPMISPDGKIGFLSVYFDHIQSFPTDQVELLQTFASQAAIAVSNARLHAHTDEALSRRAHQLSILEAVGRELSATIQSDRLFQIILNYALEFTNSPWGSLGIFDPVQNTLIIKANQGYSDDQIKATEVRGISGRVIRTKTPALVADVTQDPDFLDATGGVSRSQLSVPILYEGRVLGMVTLESPKLNAYSPADQSFISQLSNQAAIAIINNELYRESQRRLREQSSLYLVSTHLVGNLELESVLGTVNQAIGAALDSPLTQIYLWDSRQDAYILKGKQADLLSNQHNPLPKTIPGGQLRTQYPKMQKTNTLRVYQTTEQLISQLDICERCQALILPLTISGEHFGVVISHVPVGKKYSEEELGLPRAIAAQGSIALQNALLFQDVNVGLGRLEAVLNSVGEGIMMVGIGGDITLANPLISSLTDIPINSLIGTRLHELPESALRILALTREKALELVRLLASGHIPAVTKSTVQAKSLQPPKVLEITLAPIWGENDAMIGVIIVVRDVTEEYEIDQAREVITQTLVHDLKSPMGAILSSLYLIDETTANLPGRDEVIDQSLAIARRSSLRVVRMVEALLDIARMQSGKMTLEPEMVNIKTLLNDVVSEFIPRARETGTVLKLNEVPLLPDIQVDKGKIARVLANLLDNAIKFTPEGGQITLSASLQSDQTIQFQIADQGPGIPIAYRQKVFERFLQVPGIKGRNRGSGLGLTFCRLAVQAHGGQIWVTDGPLGGSVFNFTLPLEPRGITIEPVQS